MIDSSSSATRAHPRRRPGGPPRWTAADKATHLAAFATSRQTIRAYCEASGVPRATFNLWQREAREARRRRRASRRSEAEGPTFARVELPTPVAARAITMIVRGITGLEAELTGLDPAAVVVVMTGLLRPRSA